MSHQDNPSAKPDSKPHFLKERASTIKILILLSSVVILYHQDLIIIGNEALKSEITSYMLAIPFLLAYVIYRKRKVLKAAIHLKKQKANLELDPDEILGFALCLSSILLYVYGSYSFYALQWHLLSLPFFALGCLLLMFNYRVFRESIFPISFLLLLIPLPLDILNEAGTETSLSTLTVSYNILKTLKLPVGLQLEDALITLQNPSGQNISFMIDVPCGGFYTIIGFLVFATFATYMTYGPLWKKAALFPTGLLLIYSLNIFRVISTISISYFQDASLGMNLFHLLGGPILIFLASIILLVIGQKAFSLEITAHRNQREACSHQHLSNNTNEPFCLRCGKLLAPLGTHLRKRDLIKLLTILTLVALITSSQLRAFVLAGSSLEIEIRKATGEEITQQFLPPIEGYEPNFIGRDKQFEDRIGQDASLVFAYLPKKENKSIVWVAVEIADARSKLHPWDVCLLFWPEKIGKETVNVIELKDVQILEAPPLIGRLFIFNSLKTNRTVSILYWYERVVFNIASNWGPRYIKISLLAYLQDLIKFGEITGVQDYPKIETKLLLMAKDIATHWEPIKTWSIFTPLFAKWSPAIIFSVMTTSLLIKLTFEIQKRKHKEKLYRRARLSSRFIRKDKIALTIVDILRKHGNLTAKEILKLYRKNSREPIDYDDFLEILKYAEDEELIERDIKNSRDEGLLAWKTPRKLTQIF